MEIYKGSFILNHLWLSDNSGWYCSEIVRWRHLGHRRLSRPERDVGPGRPLSHLARHFRQQVQGRVGSQGHNVLEVEAVLRGSSLGRHETFCFCGEQFQLGHKQLSDGKLKYLLCHFITSEWHFTVHYYKLAQSSVRTYRWKRIILQLQHPTQCCEQ